MSSAAQLAENLATVRNRIAEAAKRSGRDGSDITLVAVTKYVGGDVVRQLAAAGCTDFGESRPQELWAKAESITDLSIRWHLIGHLQRNKVQRILPLVSLVHSGDSMRLLQAINQSASVLRRRVPVLIEVNISGDATKHGFAPADVEANLAAIAAMPSIEIRGLMGMAGREENLDQAHREFAQLRALRDQLRRVAPPQIKLEELSMGMSGDFEAAIEEGATIVRIGSALLEGIDAQSS